MFRGRFFHTIDPKGRVSIPAKFWDALESDYSEKRLVIVPNEYCLEVHPMKEWEEIEAKGGGPPRRRIPTCKGPSASTSPTRRTRRSTGRDGSRSRPTTGRAPGSSRTWCSWAESGTSRSGTESAGRSTPGRTSRSCPRSSRRSPTGESEPGGAGGRDSSPGPAGRGGVSLAPPHPGVGGGRHGGYGRTR